MPNPELDLLAACCAPTSQVAARVADALEAPVDWRLLIDRSNAQGTLPLLSRVLDSAGTGHVPPEFLAEIRMKAASKTIRGLVMASELAHAMRNFESAGLTAITFK